MPPWPLKHPVGKDTTEKGQSRMLKKTGPSAEAPLARSKKSTAPSLVPATITCQSSLTGLPASLLLLCIPFPQWSFQNNSMSLLYLTIPSCPSGFQICCGHHGSKWCGSWRLLWTHLLLISPLLTYSSPTGLLSAPWSLLRALALPSPSVQKALIQIFTHLAPLYHSASIWRSHPLSFPDHLQSTRSQPWPSTSSCSITYNTITTWNYLKLSICLPA